MHIDSTDLRMAGALVEIIGNGHDFSKGHEIGYPFSPFIPLMIF